MWPQPPAPEQRAALRGEVPISQELDEWTSPELRASTVRDLVCCGDTVVLLLQGSAGFLRESRLAAWRPAADGASGAALRPLALTGFPAPPESFSSLWPNRASGFLAQSGAAVWRVALAATEFPADGSAVPGTASLVFSGEKLGSIASLACSTTADGGLFCAMLVSPAPQAAKGPVIMTPGQSLQQLPAASLCVFEPQAGLRAVADVPRLSEQLVLSAGERKLCVWRALLNEIPEEAERGEFLALDLTGSEKASGKLEALCLTSGAGRVGDAAVSEDGGLVLLQANHSLARPVTTHMALTLLLWPRGEPEPRPERRALVVGQHVASFGFLSAETFAVTVLEGVAQRSSLWRVAAGGAEVGSAALATPVSFGKAVMVPASGIMAYGSEGPTELPFLAAVPLKEGGKEPAEEAFRRLELPQPAGMELFKVEKVTYPHGGETVTALLYERREPALPADAPLLVLAHGGPAAGFPHLLRRAGDSTRYPIRHFLVSGHRVFEPLFRGTLGFGDAWAQANIGGQGSLQGDLGDIVAGVKWLNAEHPELKGTVEPARTGIFGGSYGGYMTIRAMSDVPELFGAGVALYGFVHNRWMTYEGGDFTWEDEYIMPPADEGGHVEMELVELEESLEEATREAPRKAVRPASPSASPADSPNRSRAASVTSRSPSDVWPLPKEMEKSDTFNGLHRITKPLLFMHGEKDDVCPLSQSHVAFRMLEKQGVPTGLVIYPGEGHGFDEPAHQRDRDRRMLAWWGEFLEGSKGQVPDAFRSKI